MNSHSQELLISSVRVHFMFERFERAHVAELVSRV